MCIYALCDCTILHRLCCLGYEDDEYIKCGKNLKSVGSIIKYKGKDATVIGVDILNKKYKIIVDEQKILVDAEEI